MIILRKSSIYNLLINVYIFIIGYYSFLYASTSSIDFVNIISIIEDGSPMKWIREGEVLSGAIILLLYHLFGDNGVFLFNSVVTIIFLKILYCKSNIKYDDFFSFIAYILLSTIILYNPIYADFTNQQSRQFLLLSILIFFLFKEFETREFKLIKWLLVTILGTLIHKSAILLILIFWISIYGITHLKKIIKLNINKSILGIIILLTIFMFFKYDSIYEIIQTYLGNEESINLSIIGTIFSSLGITLSFFFTLIIVFLLMIQKLFRESKIVLMSISLLSIMPLSIFGISLYEILTRVYKPSMLLLVMLTFLSLFKERKLFLYLLPIILLLFIMTIMLQYNKFNNI